MGWVFGIVAFSLGLLFLWGLVAPRGQWRSLVGWSVADEHDAEPGGTAYGVRRLVSGLALVSLLAVVGVSASSAIARTPTQERPETPLQAMWGTVAPTVVNRIVTSAPGAPPGLVEIPVAAYQDFEDDIPGYVTRLREFELLGDADPNGLVGDLPPVGNGALDFADIVINVRGPILCIPRAVVLVQTDTEVRVGVYYGLPTADDGTERDSVAGCPVDSTVTGSILIPLQLAAPLGERPVVALDGTPISEVPVIEE
ncbi:hypothetical protein [Antiquaquibacter soli]|uniref:Uncharacterized protein n=1 Tax=Antiquaquibacter soli TaxID=3064523 RepID=A0ABT9BJR8_9MICO|nr:hypothetical protein [Protaetiibacter sp. WY-16]MDO7881268.1 hypothetical protein [Protaetiibacter sp. WY-16]